MSKAGDLGCGTLAALVGGAVGGFVVGAGVSIARGDGGEAWSSAPPEIAGVMAGLGAVGVPIAYLVMALVSHSRAEAAKAARAREGRERELVQRAQERERRREQLVSNLMAQGYVAVQAFSRMPEHLAGSRAAAEQAVVDLREHAYSPLWAAIEASYAALASYRKVAEGVCAASQRHTTTLRELRDAGARQEADALALFPVALDVGRVTTTVDDAAAQLEELVYTAQRDATFSLIWEQRRTTAAVIAGFASLESAVQGMRSALVSTLHGMRTALFDETQQARREASATAGRAAVIRAQDVDQLRELARSAEQIRGELYRQNWGSYPLLR